MGFLGEVPRLPILHETIRNLYFHVTMWFAMIFILGASLVSSIKYLSKSDYRQDIKAEQYAYVGILLGMLGIITGSVWAHFTWGAWWVNDPKLNGAAISILIYFAYIILRNSMDEEQKRARVAAVYNIFAFVLLLVFFSVVDRLCLLLVVCILVLLPSLAQPALLLVLTLLPLTSKVLISCLT